MNYYLISPLLIVSRTYSVLTYHSNDRIPVGAVVEILVGKKKAAGIVIAATTKPDFVTKPIQRIINDIVIPKQLIDLHAWMTEYYLSHPVTVWQTILPAGLLKKRRIINDTSVKHQRDRTTIVLNPQQRAAIKSIMNRPNKTTLLHGVTGSGKTTVYIELIKNTLSEGQSVIILVPEIALTSQIVSELSLHFDDVSLTHSTMTESARHQMWRGLLQSKKPRIVVGPRSALFAPLQHIGLIIIDECHEPSFKQEKSPRYSALRTASILARSHGARLVMGSATPLVSDYYVAQSRDASSIITIPDLAKPGAVLPTTRVVDLTNKSNFADSQLFSRSLIAAITKQRENGGQTLLFHNRRGSAPITLCENCGWNALCPRCYIPLTLHADTHTLDCHLCGHHGRVPTTCPDCNHANVIHKGIGTKRIEDEVRRLFPDASIARFDGDTTSGDTVDSRYSELYRGDIDIIIGTQVIAKGLDLPHLRLVGVIQADSGLAMPDFQSTERVFQLLAQVSGRVGRNEHPSEVIIQSFQPDHPSIRFGVARDYTGFYTFVLSERQRGHFPPYTYLMKATCAYRSESSAVQAARELQRTLAKHAEASTVVHGPFPAFYERVRDSYRWQIIIKSSSRSELLRLARFIPPTKWQFELDPTSLL